MQHATQGRRRARIHRLDYMSHFAPKVPKTQQRAQAIAVGLQLDQPSMQHDTLRAQAPRARAVRSLLLLDLVEGVVVGRHARVVDLVEAHHNRVAHPSGL